MDNILNIHQRSHMKNLNYYLFSIPCIYSAFAYYKTASLADALIIACFCAIVGIFSYLDKKFPNKVTQKSELEQLEEDLRLERAKLTMERLKTEAVNEKSRQDSLAAIRGISGQSKEVRF